MRGRCDSLNCFDLGIGTLHLNVYYDVCTYNGGLSFSECRYGFNGKENDNEVKGEGNQIDFGARIYDHRIGRWFATDKLSAKYASVSPYTYTLSNPVLFIDPDGNDVVVSIKRNEKGGGGTIVFSSTVYVEASGIGTKVEETQEHLNARVKSYNDALPNFKGVGTYKTDKEEWNVEVKITFKVATAEDVTRITNAREEEFGDNLAKVFPGGNGRAYAGAAGDYYRKSISNDVPGVNGVITEHKVPDVATGNTFFLALSDDARTPIHEDLHLLGLGDRYSDISYEFKDGDLTFSTAPDGVEHIGFEGDIMAKGWNFSPVHVANLAQKALDMSKTKGDNFVMGRKVDRSSKTDTKAVPQKWTSGKTDTQIQLTKLLSK